MTSQDFVLWLKGFTEGVHEYNVTPKQWDLLKTRLSKVNDDQGEDQEELENDFFGHWEENDERMNVIGQNGNEGTHYDSPAAATKVDGTWQFNPATVELLEKNNKKLLHD